MTIIPGFFGFLFLALSWSVGAVFAFSIGVAFFTVFAFFALLGFFGSLFLFFFLGFLKGFDQFLKPTKALDLFQFFRRQRFLKLSPQPLIRNHRFQHAVQVIQALEIGSKRPIKFVVVLLVFAKTGPRQQIKVVDVGVYQTLLERLKQIHQLPQGARDLVFSQR